MATWLRMVKSPEYNPAKIHENLQELTGDLGRLGEVAFLDKIERATLGETVIIGGFLNTELIAAKSIFAQHLDVNTLSSISADIGDITSGSITGAKIKTSTSGERLELELDNLSSFSTNNQAIKLAGRKINLYDWEGTARTEPIGAIYSSRHRGDATRPGIAIGNEVDSYFTIVYADSDNYSSYIQFDKNQILAHANGYPIIVFEKMYLNDDLSAYGALRFHRSNSARLNVGSTNQYLNIIMDYNGLLFGTATGTNVLQYSSSSQDWLFSAPVRINSSLNVTGSKNSLQETENYGERLINAYETAEYYFGDIGSGAINSDGECIVYIDEIFQECINVDIEYHVFTQVYNGEIKKIIREKNYFVVYGEPNTEFSWEIKAKRKGYEHHRLEQPNKFGEAEVVNFDPELIEERETKEDRDLIKIFEDEMDSNLATILLQEV